MTPRQQEASTQLDAAFAAMMQEQLGVAPNEVHATPVADVVAPTLQAGVPDQLVPIASSRVEYSISDDSSRDLGAQPRRKPTQRQSVIAHTATVPEPKPVTDNVSRYNEEYQSRLMRYNRQRRLHKLRSAFAVTTALSVGFPAFLAAVGAVGSTIEAVGPTEGARDAMETIGNVGRLFTGYDCDVSDVSVPSEVSMPQLASSLESIEFFAKTTDAMNAALNDIAASKTPQESLSAVKKFFGERGIEIIDDAESNGDVASLDTTKTRLTNLVRAYSVVPRALLGATRHIKLVDGLPYSEKAQGQPAAEYIDSYRLVKMRMDQLSDANFSIEMAFHESVGHGEYMRRCGSDFYDDDSWHNLNVMVGGQRYALIQRRSQADLDAVKSRQKYPNEYGAIDRLEDVAVTTEQLAVGGLMSDSDPLIQGVLDDKQKLVMSRLAADVPAIVNLFVLMKLAKDNGIPLTNHPQQIYRELVQKVGAGTTLKV